MKSKTSSTAKQDLNNTCDHSGDDIENYEQHKHIPEFTRRELTTAIDSVHNGKSADKRRMKAEEIKGADEKHNYDT